MTVDLVLLAFDKDTEKLCYSGYLIEGVELPEGVDWGGSIPYPYASAKKLMENLEGLTAEELGVDETRFDWFIEWQQEST